MEYIISDRLQGVKGSIIRELFKLMKDPNIISFGGGNPSAETFPVEDIARITAEIFAKNPIGMLQYGLSEGYDPLRETMKAHLTKNEGFDFTENELFIVSGGQQAADLTAKVFLNEGDAVITEEPSFIGCMNTFRSYNAKLVGVEMKPDGMDIDKSLRPRSRLTPGRSCSTSSRIFKTLRAIRPHSKSARPSTLWRANITS